MNLLLSKGKYETNGNLVTNRKLTLYHTSALENLDSQQLSSSCVAEDKHQTNIIHAYRVHLSAHTLYGNST
jgi:hypothetical protein